MHQDIAKRRGLSRFNVEKIDIDRVAFRDTILSAASFDYCVSQRFSGEKKPRKIPRMRDFDKRKRHSHRSLGRARCRSVTASTAPEIISTISPLGG